MTQEEAQAEARELLATLGGGELETRGEDGRIRQSWTIGVPENRQSPG